jgi:hypothetical protein
MALSADQLYNGLLQYNYFPAQRKIHCEVPRIFTSKALTVEIANEILAVKTRTKWGFDAVNYTATRFDLVSRIMQVPFPKAYVDLCNCIQQHWPMIKHICSGKMSCVKPARHKDGRVIIMDYKDESDIEEKEHWEIQNSFGKRFGIRADITNFYPSIYTHVIGWAVDTFETAKRNSKRGSNKQWYDQLDMYQRHTMRNETKGVSIGPGTSNIIAELILQRIDDELSSHFDGQVYFRRYIDDYQGYADSREIAEKFIRQLSVLLSKYHLHLNTRKTFIYPLPDTSDSAWMNKIKLALPPKFESYLQAKRFLDYAIDLSKKQPDKSVLKYASRCVLNSKDIANIPYKNYDRVISYIVNLAYHYPVLIPLLDASLIPANTELWASQKDSLLLSLKEAIWNHRSDAIVWILYFCLKFDERISNELAENIIETADCLPILLLYKTGGYEHQIIDFATQIIADCSHSEPFYGLDNQWLLLYQLFLDGKITNPYPKSDLAAHATFEILKMHNVCFTTVQNDANKNNSMDNTSRMDFSVSTLDAFLIQL